MCHRNGLRCGAALLALIFVLLTSASAAEYRAGNLVVRDPWARPAPPAVTVGAVYFSVMNGGPTADRLLSISTPIAQRVEIHETKMVDGMMQMRAVTSVECPPGATVRVEPGGLHVMLIGLNGPLKAGQEFPLSLRFRDAGAVAVRVPVGDRE